MKAASKFLRYKDIAKGLFLFSIGGTLGFVDALGVYLNASFLITESKFSFFAKVIGWYSIFFVALLSLFTFSFLFFRKLFLNFIFFKKYFDNLFGHYLGIGISFYLFIYGIDKYIYFFPRWFKLKVFKLSGEENIILGIILWFLLCLIFYLALVAIVNLLIQKFQKKIKLYNFTVKCVSVFGFIYFINATYLIFSNSSIFHYFSKSENKKRAESYNIVLISIDALRPDHLSCYGYQKISTPNLDMVAKEGVRFNNAFANASWTLPSLQSLFTSLYPDVISQCQKIPLPSRVVTLAEVLSKNRWVTVSVLSNPNLIPQFNVIKGFRYNHHTDELFWIKPIRNTRLYKVIGKGFRKLFLREDAKKLTEIAIKYLEKFSGEKVFLWIHYLEPHLPYRDPWVPIVDIKGYSGRFRYQLDYINANKVLLKKIKLTEEEKEHIKFLYDQDIKYVDEQIGNLFKYLKDKGLWDRALIIITADHGEELFEHNSIHHGQTLYQEVVRVPLLIKFPYQNFQQVIDYPVQLLDLAPTILDYLGYPIPEQMQGRSLMPLISGGKVEEQDREQIYSTCLLFKKEPVSSLRDKRYTFIYHYTTGKLELYDRLVDYWEQNNIAEERPDLTRKYLKTILSIKSTNQKLSPKYSEEWSEKQIKKIPIDIQRLRALGYIK